MPLPAIVAVLIALTAAAPLAAPRSVDPTARVRPQGARATALLRSAQERSPSVQALTTRLESGDVIVYLDVAHTLEPTIAGCLTWMAATETRRIVRVTLRANLRTSEAIAMIAHELHHAVEVLEHPEVRSKEALLALYQRIGRPTGWDRWHFDTPAAVAAGTLALTEVTRGEPARRPVTERPGM